MKQWRPPNSHTPKNAHKGLGRLGHGGPQPPPAAFPHLTHAPPHAHSQPPPQAGPPRSIPGQARPRLAPLPPTFRTQLQPPTSRASQVRLSLSLPQSVLPTTPTPNHKGASHNTDPSFHSRAPPRQNPRKLKGETAGEGKQREEAKGGREQKDGPEAIWSVLPASATVARRDQIF